MNENEMGGFRRLPGLPGDPDWESSALEPIRVSNKFTHDFGVFIGRFQPAHKGHLTVIDEALRVTQNVIILIGSAFQARSHRNPWTWQERAKMILNAYSPEEQKRIHCTPLLDVGYNDTEWVSRVRQSVQGIVCQIPHNHPPKIALIGHQKDRSSYYLKLFPDWDSINVPQNHILNATDIRELYFADDAAIQASNDLPQSSKDFLKEFNDSEEFKNILEEFKYIKTYRKAWENTPYPVIFVTTDAVVVQSGHVLLVKRKASPGKGLWAMPGGFLNKNEKIEDGMIRELLEETKIKVPEDVLRGSIKHRQVFDDPHRSARGRIITHAFLIELKPMLELPRVKGSDDAAKAKWVPISDLKSELFFEDHYSIINAMLAAGGRK